MIYTEQLITTARTYVYEIIIIFKPNVNKPSQMKFRRIILKIVGCLLMVSVFNEFIIYYATLLQVNIP